MPPKDGEKDELDIVKGELQARDLQILCSNDKIARLEERTHNLSRMIQETRSTAAEKEKILEDHIAALTRDAKDFDRRSEEMEITIVTLRKDRKETHANLVSELTELKSTHKVQIDAIQKELDDAHATIQAVKEFTLRRPSIEKEIQGLRDQLAKEKREHQDALNDVERVALQERERLRREMVTRIEETKVLMIKQTEDQLHSKTKRTIQENEQLAREVAYHIRQTELLVLKNEQLAYENTDLGDKMTSAKELEEELARKNHNYQKAARILLFKLQEQHLSTNVEAIEELEELKQLINHNENLKADIHKEQQDLERVKTLIEEKSRTAESVGAAEEAVKFLYACLEDVELEELADVALDSEPTLHVDGEDLQAPNTCLDKLPIQQRQEFLKHLLRTAISVRVMMQRAAAAEAAQKQKPNTFGSWSHITYHGEKERPKVSVEDIFAFQLDAGELQSNLPARRVSIGVQTCVMDDSPRQKHVNLVNITL